MTHKNRLLLLVEVGDLLQGRLPKIDKKIYFLPIQKMINLSRDPSLMKNEVILGQNNLLWVKFDHIFE